MTNQNAFEVPEQMREIAEQSVAQARKAFDSFITATSDAVTKVEGSASAVSNSAQDVNKKALSYAEANIEAAFSFAEQLARSKNVQEVMQLQADFMQKQMNVFGEQARDLTDVVSKAAASAADK